MRSKLYIAIVAALSWACFFRPAVAAEKEESKSESKAQAKADLQVLVGKVQSKFSEGKKTEKEFADELKEFDALLAKYKDQKTEDVAQILLMKAQLYLQIFDDTEKGTALIRQLKTDFPETSWGKKAEEMLTSLQQQEAGKKIQRAMAPGSKFPDFEEKDLAGRTSGTRRSRFFWCGPCVGELPNVLKTYQKYHSKGFEIIGISLDQDKTKLTDFIENRKMSWQQYFDGKGWANKLAAKYGVQSIPATYLLDGEGKIIAKNLRGEGLEIQVGKLLDKN